jgi:hypothetical protein
VFAMLLANLKTFAKKKRKRRTAYQKWASGLTIDGN